MASHIDPNKDPNGFLLDYLSKGGSLQPYNPNAGKDKGFLGNIISSLIEPFNRAGAVLGDITDPTGTANNGRTFLSDEDYKKMSSDGGSFSPDVFKDVMSIGTTLAGPWAAGADTLKGAALLGGASSFGGSYGQNAEDTAINTLIGAGTGAATQGAMSVLGKVIGGVGKSISGIEKNAIEKAAAEQTAKEEAITQAGQAVKDARYKLENPDINIKIDPNNTEGSINAVDARKNIADMIDEMNNALSQQGRTDFYKFNAEDIGRLKQSLDDQIKPAIFSQADKELGRPYTLNGILGDLQDNLSLIRENAPKDISKGDFENQMRKAINIKLNEIGAPTLDEIGVPFTGKSTIGNLGDRALAPSDVESIKRATYDAAQSVRNSANPTTLDRALSEVHDFTKKALNSDIPELAKANKLYVDLNNAHRYLLGSGGTRAASTAQKELTAAQQNYKKLVDSGKQASSGGNNAQYFNTPHISFGVPGTLGFGRVSLPLNGSGAINKAGNIGTKIAGATGRAISKVADNPLTRSSLLNNAIKILAADGGTEANKESIKDPSILPKTVTDIQGTQAVNLTGSDGKPIKLTSQQQKDIADARDSLKILDNLNATIDGNKGRFGPIVGRLLDMNQWDTKQGQIQTQIASAAQIIGKSLEGGKLTEQDIQRYKKMLPQETDTPERAKAKLEAIRLQLKDRLAQLYSTYNNPQIDPSQLGAIRNPYLQSVGQ